MPSAKASKTFDWAGHVMSNPSAYPDVFVSIFLALDLETVTLDICERVSGSWRDFIRGYLWQSTRVLVCPAFDLIFCGLKLLKKLRSILKNIFYDFILYHIKAAAAPQPMVPMSP